MKSWPDIASIDMSLIKERLQGNYSLFTELAANFAEQTPQILGKANESLGQDDFQMAAKYFHQLKGKCANLAVMKLAALADQLEQSARKGHRPDDELLKSLMMQIQPLAEQLGRIDIAHPDALSAEFSLEAMRYECQMLEQLLKDNRMDAIDISQKLYEKTVANTQIQQLHELVSRLQFKQALQKLQQLMRKVGFEQVDDH